MAQPEYLIPAERDQPGELDDHFHGNFHFEVRDKPIAAPVREASGAVALSPTAAEARGACGRYAQYLSFTAPNEVPESEHFTPGKLTSEVVASYNNEDKRQEWKGLIRQSYAFEVAGAELPVLRLADGKSLVTCTFVRTDHWEGKAGPSSWFKYGNTTGGVRADFGDLFRNDEDEVEGFIAAPGGR
ncbi:hypothetical protein [Streptomyces sp. NBC_00122]|uniref:hypothetical protein n=1 Tax=Streptomyces sp. NBC_00122 TaxID=2903623 RepID=UPI00324EF2B2